MTEETTNASNETAWIRGTLRSTTGRPLADDTVYVEDADGNRTRALTNESGAFALRASPNRTYTLVYRQRAPNHSSGTGGNVTAAGPDGVPDVHVVAPDLNSSTGVDLGNESLPDAHAVEVSVRNGSSPVSNGSVSLRLSGDEEGSAAAITVDGTTTADGLAAFEAYGTALEVADSTVVEASGDRPRTTVERRTVTGNATLELLVDDEPPTVRTAVLESPVNVGQNTTITAANSTDDTAIRLYRWDTPYNHFTTPSPTFTTPYLTTTGVYNVSVTVVDGAGRNDTTEVRIPVVDEIPPEAAINLTDGSPMVGETVALNASGASDNGRIAEYRWDTDGDEAYEAVTASPTFRTAYESIGDRRVAVEVVDGANNTATATRNVTVHPNATIRASATTVGVGERVRFDVARRAPNVTYEWRYNDTRSPGATEANFTTRTVADVSHNTTYEVILRATSGGLTATSNETVRVVNYPPNVSVDVPEIATAGSTVTLDASGTTDRDADGPLTYNWTRTNGTNVSLANADGATASFTAPEVLFPTTVNGSVAVTDEHGRTAERNVSVPVRPAPDFEYKPYAYPNETVPFALSNVADGRDAVTEYRWRFGDGGTSANRSPNHSYPETGTYPVTLRLNTTRGEPSPVSAPVSVIPRPEISLPTPEPVAANATVTLNASVPEGIVGETYTWHVEPATETDDSALRNVTRTRVTESPSLTFAAPSNVTEPLKLNVTVEVVDIKASSDAANATLAVASDSTGDGSGEANGTDDGGSTGGAGGSSGAGTSGSTGVSSSGSGGSSGASPGGASSTGGAGTGGGGSSGGSSSSSSSSASSGDGGSSGGGSRGSSSSGGSASGSAGSGGSSGGSDPSAGNGQRDASESGPPRPEVRVRPGEAGAATVTVRNVTGGSEMSISLPDESGPQSAAAFEAIDLATPPESSGADVGEAFELRTRQRESRPSNVAAPPVETAFSYLTVHKDGIDNAAIETATFTFRVGTAVLDDRGVDPSAVTLYRNHGGEWSALSTSVVRNASDAVVFRAVSPGFSTFAIGVPHPEGNRNSSAGDGSTAADADGTDATTERAAARPDSADSRSEQADAARQPASADASGVGLSTVYVVALLVTVVCAVLWGYLLQKRD